jgi:hypothetical protein
VPGHIQETGEVLRMDEWWWSWVLRQLHSTTTILSAREREVSNFRQVIRNINIFRFRLLNAIYGNGNVDKKRKTAAMIPRCRPLESSDKHLSKCFHSL